MSSLEGQSTISLTLVIPWILTLAALGVGVWQFLQQQQQKNKEPFLQKQLETCFRASEAAANLAIETDPVEWEKARVVFWRLYWGPLSIVEDRAVEGAMVELGKLVPPQPVNAPKLPMSSLGVPSYELAHAMRGLILKSWNVDLPSLQEKRREQMQ